MTVFVASDFDKESQLIRSFAKYIDECEAMDSQQTLVKNFRWVGFSDDYVQEAFDSYVAQEVQSDSEVFPRIDWDRVKRIQPSGKRNRVDL